MRTRGTRHRTLGLGSASLALLIAFSCSNSAPDRGGLMLVVTRDGPLPVDRLEIQVTSKDQTLFQQSYRLPEEAELPTTLGIASNGDQTSIVKLSVVGWNGDEPIDRRDAIVTQVPTDRVAMLTIVLSARCSSKVTVDSDGQAVSTCRDEQTCSPESGECNTANVDASALPSYASGAEDTAGLAGSPSENGENPTSVAGERGDGAAPSGGTNHGGKGGGMASSPLGGAGAESAQGGAGGAGAEPVSSGGEGGTPAVDPCAGTLVCDDFEQYVGQPGPPWKVLVTGTGATVTMGKDHVFSGKSAVKLSLPSTSAYQQAVVQLKDAPTFPLPNNDLFGRMMFYAESLPSDVVHWNFVQGDGPMTLASQTSADVAYGGQNGKLMAIYNAYPASTDCWVHSSTAMPVAKWVCVEWQLDGESDTQRLWLDGVSVGDMTVQGMGQGCINTVDGGKWHFPQDFTSVSVGYTSFQKDSAARTIWLDDVAIGSERIGCPAAP